MTASGSVYLRGSRSLGIPRFCGFALRKCVFSPLGNFRCPANEAEVQREEVEISPYAALKRDCYRSCVEKLIPLQNKRSAAVIPFFLFFAGVHV